MVVPSTLVGFSEAPLSVGLSFGPPSQVCRRPPDPDRLNHQPGAHAGRREDRLSLPLPATGATPACQSGVVFMPRGNAVLKGRQRPHQAVCVALHRGRPRIRA